jgi:hypothetical protein
VFITQSHGDHTDGLIEFCDLLPLGHSRCSLGSCMRITLAGTPPTTA